MEVAERINLTHTHGRVESPAEKGAIAVAFTPVFGSANHSRLDPDTVQERVTECTRGGTSGFGLACLDHILECFTDGGDLRGRCRMQSVGNIFQLSHRVVRVDCVVAGDSRNAAKGNQP